MIERTVIRDAIVTALIAGPILVAINYGDAILSGGAVPLRKVASTMVVPFLVAAVSGTRAALRRKQDQPNRTP